MSNGPKHETGKGSFDSLFETMELGVVYQGRDGRILAANPAAERILGLTRDQLLGLSSFDPCWRLVREDGSAVSGAEHPSVVALRTGVPVRGILLGVYQAGTGDCRWIVVDSFPEFRPGDPIPFQTLTFFRDVTEQHAAESALRDSETRYRTLFDTMHEGVAFHEAICDDSGEVVDYRYLDINPSFERLTGLQRGTTVGRTVRELLPDIEADWIRFFGKVALTGEPAERESYVRELDRYYRAQAYSPRRGTFAVVFEETTAQRRAQRELERRERLYNDLVETATDLVWRCDAEGRYTFLNKAWERTFGYALDEMLGRPFTDFMSEEQAERDLALFGRLLAEKGRFDGYETVHRRKDGTPVRLVFNAACHQDDAGRIVGTQGTAHDVTERRRAEAELRKSEERFRSIMALSPDIISIIDRDGRIVYNSPAALRVHGYTDEDMIGRDTFSLIHPDDREEVTRVFGSLLENPGRHHSVQYRYRNKDGLYAWMECAASNQLENPMVRGIIAISRNIDDRVRLEKERIDLQKQLLHAQKLESLGVLAGGIAHDFNNILTTILGNAEIAKRRIDRGSRAFENMQAVSRAAVHAADLARQMLAYSGKGRFVVEPVDLNDLLEDLLPMLEVSVSKKAVLRLRPHRPLPAVEADATQIRQVVMNLVINASEAIGDADGSIDVSTGVVECDRDSLKAAWPESELAEGTYVALEVSDTGCGMGKETLARLFDPFFSTKFTGRGLGMSAVLGIVRGHDGAITVDSVPGRGTTFTVLLPASGRPAERAGGPGVQGEWTGKGKVLLVEDEEPVRAVGAQMLEDLGFTPVTAGDGVEALEAFRRDPGGFTAVVLDLTMPRMGGERCFREIRRISPDAKVLIVSGFGEQAVEPLAAEGLVGFISKPYTLETLREALRKVLP